MSFTYESGPSSPLALTNPSADATLLFNWLATQTGEGFQNSPEQFWLAAEITSPFLSPDFTGTTTSTIGCDIVEGSPYFPPYGPTGTGHYVGWQPAIYTDNSFRIVDNGVPHGLPPGGTGLWAAMEVPVTVTFRFNNETLVIEYDTIRDDGYGNRPGSYLELSGPSLVSSSSGGGAEGSSDPYISTLLE